MLFLFFFFFKIYLWLCWVLIAVHGPSPVSASRCYSLVAICRLIAVASLAVLMGSRVKA